MIKGEYKGASLGTLIALLVVAVVLIAAIGLGGGDENEEPAEEPEPTTSGIDAFGFPAGNLEGPLIRQSPPFTQGGRLATTNGTLVLEDGCILLETVDQTVPIWPAGTTWDPAEESVVLHTGVAIPLGSTVTGPGGLAPSGELPGLAADEEAADALERCAAPPRTGVWVFWNTPDAVQPG